ncbi:hypothetical protein Hanom_Chr15g01390561 [Helianthus anomalus]
MPFPFSFHLHIERVRARRERERGAGESLEERKSGKVFGWRPQRKGSLARFGDMDQPITGIATTLLLELDMDSLSRNKHELTVILKDVTSNRYIVIRGANEPSYSRATRARLEKKLKRAELKRARARARA